MTEPIEIIECAIGEEESSADFAAVRRLLRDGILQIDICITPAGPQIVLAGEDEPVAEIDLEPLLADQIAMLSAIGEHHDSDIQLVRTSLYGFACRLEALAEMARNAAHSLTGCPHCERGIRVMEREQGE